MINDVKGVLDHIDPSALSYNEWLSVGMALKQEGHTVDEWDNWSKRDPARYHGGECVSKWNGFNGSACPVTGGTVIELAKRNGYVKGAAYPVTGGAVENGYVKGSAYPVTGGAVENGYVKGAAYPVTGGTVGNGYVRKGGTLSSADTGRRALPAADCDAAAQLIKYIGALFNDDEKVSYVTSCGAQDGRYFPRGAICDRTAGELKQKLKECGDIKKVIGDYNEKAGAWIRFNPMDGGGTKDSEVRSYRYALVESDRLSLERQYELIKETELPVAALVCSGGKSLHAIVHIGAKSLNEYKERVKYLYEYCKKRGFDIDRQNSNPSRLSRMPGVKRGNNTQYLIATNIGKESFEEWKDHVENDDDGLPDTETLSAVYDDMPPLAPCLIDGVLRQGHKMLISGPSKAGKSYALIELCIAIAEGKKWLGFDCAKGRVLYVNLELDRASCLHRFKDVYLSRGETPENICDIDVWNLRGKAVPMDKLAPKLIRRAAKKHYAAVIIDPIYKVITGDENSAEEMANFCNQLDKICSELCCSVIYCHHHSKGTQTMKKSIDRASGSGVFARDPDAILDLVEIELEDGMYALIESRSISKTCDKRLKQCQDYNDEITEQELDCTESLQLCRRLMDRDTYASLLYDVEKAKKRARSLSGWRLEATLREFPKVTGINVWFDYPVHRPDASGMLETALKKAEPQWKTAFAARKTKEQKSEERNQSLRQAFNSCNVNGKVTVSQLADFMGISERTVRRRIEENDSFKLEAGIVTAS